MLYYKYCVHTFLHSRHFQASCIPQAPYRNCGCSIISLSHFKRIFLSKEKQIILSSISICLQDLPRQTFIRNAFMHAFLHSHRPFRAEQEHDSAVPRALFPALHFTRFKSIHAIISYPREMNSLTCYLYFFLGNALMMLNQT